MPKATGTQPFFARIEARAYSRATEIPERVKQALLNLFPEDVHERVRIEQVEARGHLLNPIIVFSALLKHVVSCTKTVSFLFEQLPETDRTLIYDSLEDRIDEDCSLFLRFDKQAAFLGTVALAEVPDVVLIRVLVHRYPRCSVEEAETLIRSCLEPSRG